MCVCVQNISLARRLLKVNVYTDNGDDVLESVLTSVGESQLQCITDLISMMEQAPKHLFTACTYTHTHTHTLLTGWQLCAGALVGFYSMHCTTHITHSPTGPSYAAQLTLHLMSLRCCIQNAGMASSPLPVLSVNFAVRLLNCKNINSLFIYYLFSVFRAHLQNKTPHKICATICNNTAQIPWSKWSCEKKTPSLAPFSK